TPVHEPARGVRVLADINNAAQDLHADVHHLARLQRAGGADGRFQTPSLHLGEIESGPRGSPGLPLPVPNGTHAGDHRHQSHDLLHDPLSVFELTTSWSSASMR